MRPHAVAALLVALSPAATSGSGYRIGPGDVLEVTVAGSASSSRLVTVQTTGTIFLAPTGEVAVEGLTVEEIGFKLEAQWSRSALAEPGILVSVREYRSRFARMAGEVVRPGRVPMRGVTRLVDALLAAGGLTAAASGEIVVERHEGTFADGSRVKRVFLSGADPSPDELRELETPLAARDVVTAKKGPSVQVAGEVGRPGRYVLRRGTLREALGAAGGVTKSAGRAVRVSRVDPETGAQQVLELEPLRDADTPLLPEDHVVVPRRGR